MRIIAGKYRGKNLISPKSENIRPTADRARESVFNIFNSMLGNDWSDVDLLDLFTGSGAFGLEAMSRGAKSVTLVDIDIKDAQVNANLFPNEQDKISLIRTDIKRFKSLSKKFNLVFSDAPYSSGLSEAALKVLVENNLLTDDCICVIEVKKDEALEIPDVLELVNERTYGLAKFMFLELKEK